MSKKLISATNGLTGVMLKEEKAYAVYTSIKRHKDKRKPLFRVKFNHIDEVDRHIEQLTNLKKYMLEAGFPKASTSPTLRVSQITSQGFD